MYLLNYLPEFLYVVLVMCIIGTMAWSVVENMYKYRGVFKRIFIVFAHSLITFFMVSFVTVYWWSL